MSLKSSLNQTPSIKNNNTNPFNTEETELLSLSKSLDISSGVKGSENPGEFVFVELDNKKEISNYTNPSGAISYDSLIESKTTEIAPNSMFEYMMGVQSISAFSYNYNEREIFISKPINVEGNVVEIELETTENHPTFDSISGKANTRQTSIEYYITHKDNPNLDDWIPILPKGTEKVIGERLLPKNGEAFIIFPANMNSIKVYKNNLLLDETEFNIISNQQINIINYDESSIYTIDYIPNKKINNPHVIQLLEYKKEIQTKKEVFRGTSFNKTVELESYPFVDYSLINEEEDYNPNVSIYRPIKVKLINASIAGRNKESIKFVDVFNKEDEHQPAFTYNKTLYKDKSWSELIPYSINPENLYNGFDYYQWKNKLIFTETFNAPQKKENINLTHGVADIEVEYQYLVSSFRIKAILRKNTSEEITASPDLLNYKIKFKTMK